MKGRKVLGWFILISIFLTAICLPAILTGRIEFIIASAIALAVTGLVYLSVCLIMD